MIGMTQEAVREKWINPGVINSVDKVAACEWQGSNIQRMLRRLEQELMGSMMLELQPLQHRLPWQNMYSLQPGPESQEGAPPSSEPGAPPPPGAQPEYETIIPRTPQRVPPESQEGASPSWAPGASPAPPPDYGTNMPHTPDAAMPRTPDAAMPRTPDPVPLHLQEFVSDAPMLTEQEFVSDAPMLTDQVKPMEEEKHPAHAPLEDRQVKDEPKQEVGHEVTDPATDPVGADPVVDLVTDPVGADVKDEPEQEVGGDQEQVEDHEIENDWDVDMTWRMNDAFEAEIDTRCEEVKKENNRLFSLSHRLLERNTRLTEENRRLKEENQRLKERLDQRDTQPPPSLEQRDTQPPTQPRAAPPAAPRRTTTAAQPRATPLSVIWEDDNRRESGQSSRATARGSDSGWQDSGWGGGWEDSGWDERTTASGWQERDTAPLESVDSKSAARERLAARRAARAQQESDLDSRGLSSICSNYLREETLVASFARKFPDWPQAPEGGDPCAWSAESVQYRNSLRGCTRLQWAVHQQDATSCDELVHHSDAEWMVRITAPLDDERIRFKGYSIFNQLAQHGSGWIFSRDSGSQ